MLILWMSPRSACRSTSAPASSLCLTSHCALASVSGRLSVFSSSSFCAGLRLSAGSSFSSVQPVSSSTASVNCCLSFTRSLSSVS